MSTVEVDRCSKKEVMAFQVVEYCLFRIKIEPSFQKVILKMGCSIQFAVLAHYLSSDHVTLPHYSDMGYHPRRWLCKTGQQ